MLWRAKNRHDFRPFARPDNRKRSPVIVDLCRATRHIGRLETGITEVEMALIAKVAFNAVALIGWAWLLLAVFAAGYGFY